MSCNSAFNCMIILFAPRTAASYGVCDSHCSLNTQIFGLFLISLFNICPQALFKAI